MVVGAPNDPKSDEGWADDDDAGWSNEPHPSSSLPPAAVVVGAADAAVVVPKSPQPPSSARASPFVVSVNVGCGWSELRPDGGAFSHVCERGGADGVK
jgi:hypothetical protein